MGEKVKMGDFGHLAVLDDSDTPVHIYNPGTTYRVRLDIGPAYRSYVTTDIGEFVIPAGAGTYSTPSCRQSFHSTGVTTFQWTAPPAPADPTHMGVPVRIAALYAKQYGQVELKEIHLSPPPPGGAGSHNMDGGSHYGSHHAGDYGSHNMGAGSHNMGSTGPCDYEYCENVCMKWSHCAFNPTPDCIDAPRDCEHRCSGCPGAPQTGTGSHYGSHHAGDYGSHNMGGGSHHAGDYGSHNMGGGSHHAGDYG